MLLAELCIARNVKLLGIFKYTMECWKNYILLFQYRMPGSSLKLGHFLFIWQLSYFPIMHFARANKCNVETVKNKSRKQQMGIKINRI